MDIGYSLSVSPGFTPRPSLSAARAERAEEAAEVSPGFTPRPSLSVAEDLDRAQVVRVSPGFTPRPSLSDGGRGRTGVERRAGVAGVHAPAFVERRRRRGGRG